MGLGKTFMVLTAALYAKIVSNILVSNKEFKLPFLFGRALHLWREEVKQGIPGLSLVHRGWYPCTHAQPLPRRLFQLLDNDKPTDIAPWHPLLCVVLPSVRETFVAPTKTITAGTHLTIRDLSAEGNAEMSHTHLNFSFKFPELMWDIHVVTYNALMERGQRNPSGTPRQLTNCTWPWGISDESHRFKGPKSIGWKVVSEADIGFKVQVTATPAYHSLRDWANITRWLFAIPEVAEDPDAVAKHGPAALEKAIMDIQYAVYKDLSAHEQQAAAQSMIDVFRPWTIHRYTESKLASGAPLISIPTKIIHQVLLEWTAEEQECLATTIGRQQQQTLTEEHGVAWRVHRWQLASFSFLLQEEGDHHGDDERKWREEWEPTNFDKGPIFRWLQGFMNDLVTKSATIPLLNDRAEQFETPVPSPLRQKALVFSLLPGQVQHIQWWLRHYISQVHLVQMLSDDSPDNCTELMNEFQTTARCAVFLTTIKVGGTGLNLVAANHTVILQKPWVLNEQHHAFGRIVRLGQTRQPYCWLLNVGPGGYDDRVT